jgi:undecaprenyl-diphosphatase
MTRIVTWLKTHDTRVFFLVNRRFKYALLGALLSRITHFGGARATILATLAIWCFAPKPVSTVGMQAFIALALSHIPVAVVKKLYPRLRPYLVLPDAIPCKNPLKDHSFPSGHTTAIFSVIAPFVIAFNWIGLILIPFAMIVGMSRMYLGLHYPSDVAAGCVIGCVTAAGTVAFLG